MGLLQKAHSRPAVGEVREKSLQSSSSSTDCKENHNEIETAYGWRR
jgi:hypothetical protein